MEFRFKDRRYINLGVITKEKAYALFKKVTTAEHRLDKELRVFHNSIMLSEFLEWAGISLDKKEDFEIGDSDFYKIRYTGDVNTSEEPTLYMVFDLLESKE